MAIVLKDRLKGAQFDNQRYFAQTVRSFIIDEIDNLPTDGSFDPAAFIRSLATAGVPQLYDKHPTDPRQFVVRHLLQGVAADQVSILIYYETPTGGSLPGSAWLVRDDTVVTQETTQRTANNADTLTTKFVKPISANIEGGKVPTVPVYIPRRAITANRVKSSPLPENMKDAVGSINRSTWRGKPRGSWLLYAAVDEQQGNGTYVQSLTFLHNRESWFSLSHFIRPNGDIIGTIQGADSPSILTVQDLPAEGGQTVKNGLTLASIYPENDFTQLFPDLKNAGDGYQIFNGTAGGNQ